MHLKMTQLIIHATKHDSNNSITTEFIWYGNDPDDIGYILPTYGSHLWAYMSDNNSI